jgi:hypothetical protein
MKDSGRAVADGQTSSPPGVNSNSVAVRASPTPPVHPTPWSAEVVSTKLQETRKWNVKNLPARVAVDISSAACAAVLVAPVIATIDK